MKKSKQHLRIGRLVIVVIATILVSPAAYAAHNGGSDTGDSPLNNASCNASFLNTCVADPLESSTFAAPWPDAGGSLLEIGFLALVMGALLLRKRLLKVD